MYKRQHQNTGTGENNNEVLSPSLDGATGERAVFVRFKGQGAYAQTQPDAVRSRAQAPVNAQAQVQAIRASVQQQGASAAKESGAQVLYTTHNTMRGVALYGNVEQMKEQGATQEEINEALIRQGLPDVYKRQNIHPPALNNGKV